MPLIALGIAFLALNRPGSGIWPMTLERDIRDGFTSAVVGFVIAILLPVFLKIFEELNAPGWVDVAFVIYVVIVLVVDFLNNTAGGLGYTIGFAFGAWAVGDWWLSILAFVVYVAILYLKQDGSSSGSDW
jgi:hypothetical protein